MTNRLLLVTLLATLLVCMTGSLARAEGPNGEPDANPDPELERQAFRLPDGFEINLFAGDPMVEKPIQMNWDARGRLWCATSQTYPQVAPGQVPDDKIYVLEDTKGIGKADKGTIFADHLFLPTAVVPGDGGVYVTNSTEILHLKDSAGTGKADTRRVVLAGFGTEDTHHIVHTLRWGPDGRLYFLQSIYIHSHLETPRGVKTLLASGVWRFDTRTLDLNVYSRGLVNPWGIVWDQWGQTFQTDGAGGQGINYAFSGIGFESAVGLNRTMPGLNPGSPKYCGAEILSGGNMPEDYQGDILTNDFRANRVVRFKLADNGAGFTARQMEDFITSTDRSFRPVDIKMGPDGAIYIADWYNPIINHGEVDFRDPRRDHTHGRIWRITYKGKPLVVRPRIDGASIAELLDLLKSPEDYTRSQARLALREWKPEEVLPALKSWVRRIRPKGAKADHERLEALWTCENLNVVEPELLERVLKSDEGRARAAAVRVVGHWADQLPDPTALLEPMVRDDNPRVRLEAVRALAAIPSARSVVIAARVLDKPMDPFLDYALWLTCNELEPLWMPSFESGQLTEWEKADHLNYALQAVKSPAALKTLVEQLESGQAPPQARAGIIDLIANIGGADEAGTLLHLAAGQQIHDQPTRAHLLTALLNLTARQHVRPDDAEKIGSLLNDQSDSVRGGAMRLAGAWKVQKLRPQLVDAAQSPQSSDVLRVAALDGLSSLADPESLHVLGKLSSAPTPANVRRLAIASLTTVDVKGAANEAAALIAGGDAEPGTLIAPFLAREGGGEALATALNGKRIPTDTAKLCLRYLRTSTAQEPRLTELFNIAAGTSSGPVRLSADQMKRTIAEVLAKGDAARGEQVFRRSDAGCYQCHSIAAAGGWLAPDITSIGASSPLDYIVNSVLDPNKDIKDGYTGYTIVTTSGEVYSGIKVRQDSREVVLRDNTHQEIPIPLSEIKIQKDTGSLMPNGLADLLTHQEFLDLIRFLSELGKPGPYGPTPAQFIRKWQVMQSVPDGLMSSTGNADLPAALDRQTWETVYSLVSGAIPLDSIVPPGKSIGYARAQIDAAAPGKVRVVFNSQNGLSVWLDGKSFELLNGITPDLSRGLHTLTIRTDGSQRHGEALRVEVSDAPGSSGHAQPVGGK